MDKKPLESAKKQENKQIKENKEIQEQRNKNIIQENKQSHTSANANVKTSESIKIQELTILLKKLQAEFENYKKRVEKEKVEFTNYISQELIRKLLPVVDSFELALQNKGSKEFTKGVEMIHNNLLHMLKQEKLTEIEALGRQFDPFKHEVLISEASNNPSNTVIGVIQKGYMLKDRVIRTSKVKVSK